jgi:uncharacterized protein
VTQPVECLIIFTRYPIPGQTKTRLIPALGALGAVNLHRELTEHTLTQALHLNAAEAISVEVHVAGGEEDPALAEWLGADLVYQFQGNGDLGDRMAHSIDLALQAGHDRVIIIGTDCPGLNADLLKLAFQALHSHDLVLGPAIDGGYYLIGLRRFIPELFVGINWGTSDVLPQTVNIASKLDLSVGYLPPLADIDRPEDLPVWERIKAELTD